MYVVSVAMVMTDASNRQAGFRCIARPSVFLVTTGEGLNDEESAAGRCQIQTGHIDADQRILRAVAGTCARAVAVMTTQQPITGTARMSRPRSR